MVSELFKLIKQKNYAEANKIAEGLLAEKVMAKLDEMRYAMAEKLFKGTK